ncbi:MAG TPA: VWA domain-containing protein [Terracidiphilus sp.]|nr:VWA domain-containing protein [Terracidiphilus sp.]
MFKLRVPVLASHRISVFPVFAALAFFMATPASRPQDQSQQSQQQPGAQQQTQQQQQQAPDIGPAAGGPSGSTGPIALPKKQPADTEPAPAAPPPRPEFKNPPGAPNYSIQLQVPEVVVNVGVLLQKTGQFVPGLQPQNFRIYENGVEQKIVGFKRVQAPVTALLLCEFASRYFTWSFNLDMLNTAWAFAQQLQPQDYVALMTFDLNPHIILDFTQNKQEVQGAINNLANQVWMPAAFQETDVFDALANALDRLSRIQGQKYIILIASGVDSFSKLTFDQIFKRVKDSRNVTIFAISTGGLFRAITEGQPGMTAAMNDMTFLQADNEMRNFAVSTGGQFFQPRFEGELPDDVSDIMAMIRSKYQIVYQPTDVKQDGTYRKLRVALVDNEGKPLRMQDQKHHPLKYELIYRDGYLAKPEVE